MSSLAWWDLACHRLGGLGLVLMGSSGDVDQVSYLPHAGFLLRTFDLVNLLFLGACEVEGSLHDSLAALCCSSHAVGERADGGDAVAVGVG